MRTCRLVDVGTVSIARTCRTGVRVMADLRMADPFDADFDFTDPDRMQLHGPARSEEHTSELSHLAVSRMPSSA